MSSPRPSPFWSKDRHRDRRPFLVRAGQDRGGAPRAGSRREGFIEVEPAALQVSPGNETHLHAFATELIGPDGRRARALPPHLAGIRHEEAARRRRGEDRRLRPRLPQPRARAAARAGIHHGRVVPGRRALRGGDGGLRWRSSPRPPAPPGSAALAWRGRKADPFAARGAGHRGRRLPPPCRHRPLRRDRRSRPACRGGRRRAASGSRRTTPGRTSSAASWSRRSSRMLGIGRPTLLCEYPARRGGARPRQARATRASPSASSSMPAGSNSPTASPS